MEVLTRAAATFLACGALASATHLKTRSASRTYQQAGRLFLATGGVLAACAILLTLFP